MKQVQLCSCTPSVERALKENGFAPIPTKGQYERARLSKDSILVIIYTSSKCVIQGKESLEKIITLCTRHGASRSQTKNENSAPSVNIPSNTPIIGSDETLKGDTFGGLVVCSFLAYPDEYESLSSLGVKDSKLLNPDQIHRIASLLYEKYPDRFCCSNIFPEEYNEYVSLHSSTAILNMAHKKCVGTLSHKEPQATVVVDKYPGCTLEGILVSKAESVSIAVACASIIARDKGVEQFSVLSKRAGFTIPFGSTHVSSALKKIVASKLPLSQFVKLHFNNVQREQQQTL